MNTTLSNDLFLVELVSSFEITSRVESSHLPVSVHAHANYNTREAVNRKGNAEEGDRVAETETQTDRQRRKQTGRERHTDTDRQTETDRQRERERSCKFHANIIFMSHEPISRRLL